MEDQENTKELESVLLPETVTRAVRTALTQIKREAVAQLNKCDTASQEFDDALFVVAGMHAALSAIPEGSRLSVSPACEKQLRKTLPSPAARAPRAPGASMRAAGRRLRGWGIARQGPRISPPAPPLPRRFAIHGRARGFSAPSMARRGRIPSGSTASKKPS